MAGSEQEYFDVVVIGAGISGIGAAYRLQTRCPEKTVAILEGRGAIGGTWDLFRYPGIRSDSDMLTLGFPWHPWRGEQSLADGDEIRAYLEDAARTYGIDRKIRFGHRVDRATWSSDAARWTVEATRSDGERVRLTCRFIFCGTGYYDYSGGHTPELPGLDRYRGRVVHPQNWTDDIEYGGKRVVVIGSGATAVGIVPALAQTAAHVTMLQRSPTYVIAVSGTDPLRQWLEATLPPDLAYRVARAGHIGIETLIYFASRRWPMMAKKVLVGRVKKALRHSDVDAGTHFTPRYPPWDQRLCLVRDGDLFKAINAGKADVVTDHIDTFTEAGIRTRSGRELAADLVVTATGLNVRLLGGMQLAVDGTPVELTQRTLYKLAMLDGVPNLALSLGYAHASWTLRSDLVATFVCRLLRTMDRGGHRTCVARLRDGDDTTDAPFFPLSSGYIERARAVLPRQGKTRPWNNPQSLSRDRYAFEYAPVSDGVLSLS